MQITLTIDDLTKLKPSSRADIIRTFFPPDRSSSGQDDYDWDDVADLTPGQVEELISGCGEKTTSGLRIIAEHGPVIHASLLDDVEIESYGNFQGGVTRRTRTVTGDRHIRLFAFDNWPDQPDGIGHFAVSSTTHRSLKIYFGLE